VRTLNFMYLFVVTLGFISNMAISGPINSKDPMGGEPLQTVSSVDLERYIGKWYEIAAIPQRFQEGCAATTAEYSFRNDGDVEVINSCRLEDGSIKTARGHAWTVDDTNAKLKVRFFWPFAGDYWIIELAEDYSYAVVGHPDRSYLWILARTSEISSTLLDSLMETIETKHGYDISKIVRTVP